MDSSHWPGEAVSGRSGPRRRRRREGPVQVEPVGALAPVPGGHDGAHAAVVESRTRRPRSREKGVRIPTASWLGLGRGWVSDDGRARTRSQKVHETLSYFLYVVVDV